MQQGRRLVKHSSALYLLLMLTLFTSGGASCGFLSRNSDPLAPVVFVGPPTLDDIISATNTNSAAVRQLYSDSVTLSATGVPVSLRANLAMERPRRFRLRAKLVGPELDVGSNDELFWTWAKSDPDRAIYFARHEQFAEGAARRGLPIGVDWLIDAMGLVQLDPAGIHEGPTPRQDGTISIRSQIMRDNRPYSRVLVLDAKHGWILEQQVLDSDGRMLALARCSAHRFYQEVGASLPHHVQIEIPTARLGFQLDVSRYTVNQLNADASQLWTLPYFGEGYRPVDLGAQDLQFSQPAVTTSQHHGWVQNVDDRRSAYRPSYRGVNLR